MTHKNMLEEKEHAALTEFELQTGHYFSLKSALGAAMTRCVVWRYAGTTDKYNALQLLNLAKEFDGEHPLQDKSFYMVSAEGAIGVSPGVEYLTKWLFLPDMDEASVKELQDELRSLETPSPAGEAAKFCPHCGMQYENDSVKFCPNCGSPRE